MVFARLRLAARNLLSLRETCQIGEGSTRARPRDRRAEREADESVERETRDREEVGESGRVERVQHRTEQEHRTQRGGCTDSAQPGSDLFGSNGSQVAAPCISIGAPMYSLEHWEAARFAGGRAWGEAPLPDS